MTCLYDACNFCVNLQLHQNKKFKTSYASTVSGRRRQNRVKEGTQGWGRRATHLPNMLSCCVIVLHVQEQNHQGNENQETRGKEPPLHPEGELHPPRACPSASARLRLRWPPCPAAHPRASCATCWPSGALPLRHASPPCPSGSCPCTMRDLKSTATAPLPESSRIQQDARCCMALHKDETYRGKNVASRGTPADGLGGEHTPQSLAAEQPRSYRDPREPHW